MPLIDDTFEPHSVQALLDRVAKLENLMAIVQMNVDTLFMGQDKEDAEDTRAS